MISPPAAGSERPLALPMRGVIAGLALVMVVDLLTVLGWWPGGLLGWAVHTSILVVLPWLTLLLASRPAAVFGYQRGSLLLDLGWGVVIGSGWRLFSLLFNLAWIRVNGVASLTGWVSAIFWVPFVEETFFRGYLGRSLQAKWGLWAGNLAQALLFTLQPYHWRQGWPGILSIFGFGILAGWLMDRRGTIWPAWAAHAAANLLALLLSAGWQAWGFSGTAD